VKNCENTDKHWFLVHWPVTGSKWAAHFGFYITVFYSTKGAKDTTPSNNSIT